jgi:uncharacterized membrane protein
MNTGKKNNRKINFIRIAAGGFAVLLLVTFVLCYLKGDNQRMAISILMFKIVGFCTSVVLVIGELGHPFFDRFCPRGEKFNCHAVMESPAAKLFGLIPMADVGGIYFSGGIILICFSVLHFNFFQQIFLLALLNLLTLPYTIFSVVYQAVVVKKWCALCLIVQLTFWFEFSQFYPFLFAGIPQFTVEDFYPVLWSFGLPLFAWLFFRTPVKKAFEADNDQTTPPPQ